MINYIKQFTRPRSEWFPYQHLLLLAGVIYAFTLPVAAGWWVAAFLFFFSHLYDVLIYDIRINIASWIFLIGLRNTFKNYKKSPQE